MKLEIALDHSNKANSDLQNRFRSRLVKIKDLQIQVEEEQRIASEYRDRSGIKSVALTLFNGELEETHSPGAVRPWPSPG